MENATSNNNVNIENLLEKVLKDDPQLIRDIETHSQQDVPALVRRVDTFYKQYSGQHRQMTQNEIKGFVTRLLKCTLSVADSVKLSRSVEKIIQLHEGSCQDLIFTGYEEYLKEKMSSIEPDAKTLNKVSILFEQNSLVQDVLRRDIGHVTSWIANQMNSLVSIPPADLTPTQVQCLSSLIKISLQLFQTCPSQLGPMIWDTGESTDEKDLSVADIIQGLVHILTTEGYTSECVLLCGTSVVLMLNTNKGNNSAWLAAQCILGHALHVQGQVFTLQQMSQLKDLSLPNDQLMSALPQVPPYFLGPVAFIRAIVACGNMSLLYTHSNNQMVFMQLFKFIITLCKGDITLHYHSFSALLLWYTRLNKIFSLEESEELKRNLALILESSLQLVLVNWDSPVEDVPEVVVSIFSQVMSAWTLIREQVPLLPQQVLDIVSSTHWYVKGKYRILAALLKYVQPEEVLEKCPDLQHQLVQCLMTNHLAPASTAVYKTFLQQIGGDIETRTQSWKASWLDIVLNGLISDDSLLCYNMSLHWLPVTTKTLPPCASCLQKCIKDKMSDPDTYRCRTRWLHAWVTVTRSLRNCTGSVNLNDSLVQESLYCADEDVRSEALGLICNTLKKSEAITETEAHLLKETIMFNIKLDSAPFRQTLGANVRRLLVRLRDTSILMLKDVQKHEDKLACSVGFVDWLHGYCVECLLPGACYQRRKGALDLLQVIYDTLIYLPHSQHQKGFTPESTVSLVKYAQSRGHWMFLDRTTTHCLILTLLDSSEEIQESAFHLLTGYEGDWFTETDNKLCCHLLYEAQRLCHSPKGREGQSGAILSKLIFQRYVIDQNLTLEYGYDEKTKDFTVSAHNDGDGILTYLQALLREIERCAREADHNLVKASKQYPIHGLLSALHQCLTDTSSLWAPAVVGGLVTVVSHLITLCRSIITRMLGIMASVADQEACPSFAEIGVALENLLQENQSDYTETTAQSPEYQYMLAWCWNNIKEGCVCLGEVTFSMVSNKVEFPTQVYTEICDTFVHVLTKCRHKGVIEGTRTAFIRFCSAIFNSSQEKLIKIPSDTLKQVMVALKTSGLVSSVTRRSAGLPIIIQAVLTSERRVNKNNLLNLAVVELFEICQMPLEEAGSRESKQAGPGDKEKGAGLQDLPQVHALNILDLLYSDASLTASLMGHISRALLLVINMFSSPSWAIKNAATRLFRTLMSRVFGQKKNNDTELGSSVTFQELSAYYPELPPFLLCVLKQAAKRNIREISQLHPGLFPVLTLLSFLKPSPAEDNSLTGMKQEFSDIIQQFSVSPVYQLRNLVAPAFVAMVNMADMPSAATRSVDALPECTVNGLHGELLIISRLLDYIPSPSSTLWCHLLMICESLMSCDLWMVTSQCVHILNKVLIKHGRHGQKSSSNQGESFTEQDHLVQEGNYTMPKHVLENLADLCCKKYSQDSVGGGIFSEQTVELLFTVYLHTGVPLATLSPRLLNSLNEETRKLCLEKLSDWSASQTSAEIEHQRGEIMNILIHHIQEETSIPNLSLTFDLVTRLCLSSNPDAEPVELESLQDWFSSRDKFLAQHVSLAAKSQPVQALGIRQIIKNGVKISSQQARLTQWCTTVHDLSTRTNETQRMAAVQSLLVAGQQVLNHVTQTRDIHLEQSAIKLISACLSLIQDEDTDIRAEACKFISQLHWEGRSLQYASLHSNVCFEVFLSYLSSCMSWSARCVHFLTSFLYTPGELASIIRIKETARYQQLFDQEDNSFFAERLFNSQSIQKTLKSICQTCLADDNLNPVQGLMGMSDSLVADLQLLCNHLASVQHDSVIHKYCDNTILAVIYGLLLLAQCVAMVARDDDKRAVDKLFHEILKMNALPPPLQSRLSDMCLG